MISKNKVINLFGIPIINITKEEAISLIIDSIQHGEYCHVVTLNSMMIVKSILSRKFKEVLKKAKYCICDSYGIAFSAFLSKQRLKEVIPGIDLIRELMFWVSEHNKTIYLLGSTYDVVAKTEKNIKASFPNLRIVGRYHGYFKLKEIPYVNEAIKKANPDILFVAMGAGKQEKWIYNNADVLQLKTAIGVGGAFDIFAGRKKRAPMIFRKNKLEWFWRISTNPLRWWQFIVLLLFFTLSIINGIYLFFLKILSKNK